MGHGGQGFSHDFCGRVLKSSPKQKYHVSEQKYHVSENTGMIKYICKICEKGFNIKAILEKHVLDHQ